MSAPPFQLPADLIAKGIELPRDIIDAMESRAWFGSWFDKPGEDWRSWKTFLRALWALPMSDEEREIYHECTNRDDVPTRQAREAWVVVGRRGGKSRIAALCAAYLACFHDWRGGLAAAQSERIHIAVLAADRRQCRVVLRYLRSFIVNHPLLKQLVQKERSESIDLTVGVTIEVMTASYKTVRGYAIAAAILDELAFWPDDEATNAADEILNAIKPALATTPGSMLLGISSPHTRRGPLWENYRKFYGQPSDRVLVWQAPTVTMHPDVDREAIEVALEEDPARASAEYLAQFRTDLEAFISREVIDACTIQGRHELPPMRSTQYCAFVDPSGGSSDSFTLAIAHRNVETGVVLDLVREIRPPFSPEEATWQLAQTLQSYGINKVRGDRYAGEWPREQFRKYGIEYETSELTKSQIYAEALPVFNAHRVELLDLVRLRAQLLGLERRTARGGRESIDHGPHAHDDIANAVAGVIQMLAGNPGMVITKAFLESVARGLAKYGRPMGVSF